MGKFSWIAVRCLLLISSIHAQTFPVPLIPATVPALEYHKSCLYNQYLLLIGGNDISNPGAKTLNREFYVANTSSGITWYRATFPESSKYPLTTTNIPSTFVVLGLHKIDNSVLLLLSSSTGTSLHSFSLDTGIWSIPSASLTPLQLLGLPVQQPPQIGAGACTSQSKVVNGNESRNLVYLYGQTAGTGTSFMYLLDVEGLKWVQVSNLGRARNGVGCVGLDDGAIIMGGVPITGEGVSANALMDVFRYTLSSGNWANVTVEPGDIPVSVSDPVATILVKNSVFVYGGLTNGGQLVGTISRLELGSGGASWRLVGENVPSSSGSSVYDASRDVAIFLLTINGTSKTLESLNYKTQLQKFISNAELSAVAVAQSPSPTGDVNPTLNLPSQPPNQTTTIVVSVVVALVASLTIILIIYLKRNPSAKSRLSVEMSWVRGFNRNSSGGETSGDEEKWETSKERKLPALTRYREQMRNKQDEEKEIPVSKITGLPLFEAVADFTPFNKNEIAIKIGDWITIREHDVFSDGWCIGINETTKSVGIFPIFCLGLEQVMNEIVVTPTVPAIPSISVLPRSSSYTCGEKLEELNGLLAAAAPKSAMKSLTSKPSIRKTVKIVAPESVISESDISSMQEELANGSDGLIINDTESVKKMLTDNTESTSTTQESNETPIRQLSQSSVPTTRIGRLYQYTSLAAGVGVGAISESLRRTFSPQQQSSSVLLTPANVDRIVKRLTRMRGAALKLGQMLSIQDSSMLSSEVEQILLRVQNAANYMPDSQFQSVMKSSLSNDWRAKFQDFDTTPFAAASIGQVHKATIPESLGYPFSKVAVKVQYPGVSKSIASDLSNLSSLITFSSILPKGMYLENTIRVARVELEWECDYERERNAMKQFRELLRGDESVNVPRVVDELSTKDVLTAEFVDGVTIGQVAEMEQGIRDWVGETVLRLCLRELFEFRLMQTDPNWSNFLFDKKKRQVQLLDFGATREFAKSFTDSYVRLLYGAYRNNRDEMIYFSKTLGFLTGLESETMLNAHINSLLHLSLPFRTNSYFDFTNQDITTQVRELIPVMLRERLTPPPDESYSLHRKLSGAFLLCARIGARVKCREAFEQAISKYGIS